MISRIAALLKVTGLLVLMVVSISGCKKDDDSGPFNNNNNNNGCTTPNPPTVGSNSPVAYGGDIQLTASDVNDAIAYEWTGPNGFVSSSQNPVISSASQLNSGVYSVYVTVDGGCVSDTASVNVQVSTPSAPCNPVNNQYTLQGYPAVNFTPLAILFGVGSSGNYEVICNGSNGDIKLIFAIPTKPQPGVYNVTQLGPLAPADEVLISNTAWSAYWTTSSGLLYVTDIGGGKNRYVYCNLTMSNSTFGTSTSGSGKITEP